MSFLELQAIEALNRCSLPPATNTKRFVRNMQGLAGKDKEAALTTRQKIFLWNSVWRFRRQIYSSGAKMLVWIASLITGRTDKKYPVPVNYADPESATGPIERDSLTKMREYLSEIRKEISSLVEEVKAKPVDKKSARLLGGLTMRCGCYYVDGKIQRPCGKHSDVWKGAV